MAVTDYLNSIRKILLSGQRPTMPVPRAPLNLPATQSRSSRSVAGTRSLPGGGNSDFERFMQAISAQESGGKYGIRNRSSGAMGRYQIMPANLRGNKRGWDFEALGRDVSESEFMSNPQIQDAIARHKLQQYYRQYGPANAAIAWYGGPGAIKRSAAAKSKKQKGGYPSINSYSAAILRRMQGR